MNIPSANLRTPLPFLTIEALSPSQKECLTEILSQMLMKTEMQKAKSTPLKCILIELDETSVFLNRINELVFSSMPSLGKMKKRIDFDLNLSLKLHIENLKTINDSLLNIKIKIDEMLEVYYTTKPLAKPYKTTLDLLGRRYANIIILELPKINANHEKLLLEIKNRISADVERLISESSINLVINVHDFDKNYLQNNLFDYHSRTTIFHLKGIEIQQILTTLNQTIVAFDKDFNLLHYLVTNNYSYSPSTYLSFVTVYKCGVYKAGESYLPEVPLEKETFESFLPELDLSKEKLIMEIFTILSKKSHLIKGDELAEEPSSNHPLLLLAHFWTPCLREVRIDEDRILNTEGVTLILSIQEIVNKFKLWNRQYEILIPLAPHLRAKADNGIRATHTAEYKLLNKDLITIVEKYKELQLACLKRIELQVKTKISKVFFEKLLLSHDISSTSLESNFKSFSSFTESFKSLNKDMTKALEDMNSQIQIFHNLFNQYSDHLENKLPATITNEIWFKMFNPNQYIYQYPVTNPQ